jgi:hypothetical protein
MEYGLVNKWICCCCCCCCCPNVRQSSNSSKRLALPSFIAGHKRDWQGILVDPFLDTTAAAAAAAATTTTARPRLVITFLPTCKYLFDSVLHILLISSSSHRLYDGLHNNEDIIMSPRPRCLPKKKKKQSLHNQSKFGRTKTEFKLAHDNNMMMDDDKVVVVVQNKCRNRKCKCIL